MKGFIEIKEDSYDDTIEHLYKIKSISCKLIKMLSQKADSYDDEDDEDDDQYEARKRSGKTSKGRYEY